MPILPFLLVLVLGAALFRDMQPQVNLPPAVPESASFYAHRLVSARVHVPVAMDGTSLQQEDVHRLLHEAEESGVEREAMLYLACVGVPAAMLVLMGSFTKYQGWLSSVIDLFPKGWQQAIRSDW